MQHQDNQQLQRLFTKKKSFFREMETLSKRYFEFQQQVYYLPIKDINPDMIVKLEGAEDLKYNHHSKREDIFIVNGQYQPTGEKSFERLILQLVQTIPRPKSAYGIIYINTLADSDAYNDFKKVLELLPIQYLVNLTRIYVLNASFFNKAFSWLSFGIAITFINKKTINVEDLRELTLQSHVEADILKEKLPRNVMKEFSKKQKHSREQGPRGMCVPQAEKIDRSRPIKREHIATHIEIEKGGSKSVDVNVLQILKLPKSENGRPLSDYDLGPTGAPVILEMLIYYFNNKEEYLKEEGLFRKSVSVEDEASILDQLNKKNYNYLETVTDPHLIANAIKRFLCNIRDPIIPYSIFEEFMEKDSDPQFKRIVVERVKSLPKANRMIIFLLFDFLINKMVPYAEWSKMGVNNMCIVFGPCLMRSAVASIMDLLYARKIIMATHVIYTEFESIFGDRTSQLKLKRNSYKEYRISEMKERQSREGKESPIRLGKEESSSSSERNQQEQMPTTPTFHAVTLLNRTSLFIQETLEKVESEDEIEEIEKEEPIQHIHHEISYDQKEIKPVNLFFSAFATQEGSEKTQENTASSKNKTKM